MELSQLEYFAAVARHRHFTRAAEALYVTQPALSQQIRRLEAELGLALLRRTSQGVELTAAGADLLVHAEAVLAEVAAARAEWTATPGVSRGVARVAATAADAAAAAGGARGLPRRPSGHPDRFAAGLGGRGDRARPARRRRRRRAGAARRAARGRRGDAARGRAAAASRSTSTTSSRAPVIGCDVCAAGRSSSPSRARRCARRSSPPRRRRVQPAATVRGRRPCDGALPRPRRLGLAIVPASWLERPGPVVGAADLVHPPCHRLSLLTPAAGASPAGRLLHERLLEL